MKYLKPEVGKKAHFPCVSLKCVWEEHWFEDF